MRRGGHGATCAGGEGGGGCLGGAHGAGAHGEGDTSSPAMVPAPAGAPRARAPPAHAAGVRIGFHGRPQAASPSPRDPAPAPPRPGGCKVGRRGTRGARRR